LKLLARILFVLLFLAGSAAYIHFYFIPILGDPLQRNALLEQNRVKNKKEAKLSNEESQRLLTIKEKSERLNFEKQQAWYAWYRKREEKGCDNWQSDRHMVECINKKMDLKSEFEKVWNSQHSLSQK